MAFVILSAGTLTRSRMLTISARTFLCVIVGAMLAMLAGGVALGYALRKLDVPPVAAASVADPGDGESRGRLLIDRFGELSARIVQLHSEAAALTERIAVIREFDARSREDAGAPSAPGRAAKTPLAAPAGGPLLQPDRLELPLAQLGLQHRVPDPVRDGAVPPVLTGEVSKMAQDLERLDAAFARLDRLATSYSLAQMSFPGRAPVAAAEITSGFGTRIDPFRKGLAFHSGVDYPAPTGTPILASAGGRVIFAGRRPEYGLTVEIDHGAGLATRYAHASKLHVVVDQVVLPGQKIADVGSTGRSSGPHLHFEVLSDGLLVDPVSYLARF